MEMYIDSDFTGMWKKNMLIFVVAFCIALVLSSCSVAAPSHGLVSCKLELHCQLQKVNALPYAPEQESVFLSTSFLAIFHGFPLVKKVYQACIQSSELFHHSIPQAMG
jgi:hypothetical protein